MTILAWLLIGVGIYSVGCDDSQRDDDQKNSQEQTESAPDVNQVSWDPPSPVDLTEPAEFPTRRLELDEAQKFPDCHRLFEPDGQPKAQFPLDDEALRPLQLAGCAPEAYRVLDDGARVVGYAVPAAEKGWHLRVVYYEADGQLRWHGLLDRSANAEHFSANFSGSFITPLLPRLICAGTMWQGGTQAACFEADDGERTWSGMMKFWSGIAPQGVENSLNAATIKGLTRRYPYSGVEMRFKEFEGRGGRAGFYATDGKQLFFGPAKDGPRAMTAYALDSFQPIWRLNLPSRPQASWAHAFAEPGIVLFKLDETVYAADGESGEVLWAARVGSDEPPVKAVDDKVFVLLRRKVEPNLLYALDARSGSVEWQAEVPTGTLELHDYEDTLLLRSVRAVRKVDGLD
ncbi:MAG: PLuB system PQQ-binding repeat protein [Persicimonas sp.]